MLKDFIDSKFGACRGLGVMLFVVRRWSGGLDSLFGGLPHIFAALSDCNSLLVLSTKCACSSFPAADANHGLRHNADFPSLVYTRSICLASRNVLNLRHWMPMVKLIANSCSNERHTRNHCGRADVDLLCIISYAGQK